MCACGDLLNVLSSTQTFSFMGGVHLRRSARHLTAVGDWLRYHVYCGENRARLGTFVTVEALK